MAARIAAAGRRRDRRTGLGRRSRSCATAGRSPHRGGQPARRELRARLRPRPGPALADGVPAAPGPAGWRRSWARRCRAIASCARWASTAWPKPASRTSRRTPRPGCGLRRWRQRVPRDPHRPAAAGISHPSPPRAGAVAAGRQPGLAAPDGARPRDQLPGRLRARASPGDCRRSRSPTSGPTRRARRSPWSSWRALPWDELAAVPPPAEPGRARMPGWSVQDDRPRRGAARQRSASRPAGARRVVSRPPRDARARAGRGDPAGLPAVVLGHNGAIAWGFTNTGADTQDLFIERVDPEDPTRYLTPDGAAPFEVREERVRARWRSRSPCAPPATARCSPTCCRRGSVRGPIASWRSPGARSRMTTGTCRRCSDRQGAELAAVRRGAARRRRPDAERPLRRYVGPHRLHRAGPRADPQERRRALAGAGVDGEYDWQG